MENNSRLDGFDKELQVLRQRGIILTCEEERYLRGMRESQQEYDAETN